jgi:hypothetical protein
VKLARLISGKGTRSTLDSWCRRRLREHRTARGTLLRGVTGTGRLRPGEEEEDDVSVEYEYEDGGKTVKDEWTENHCKLVYLISRWGRAAQSAEEKETWLRQTPLFVLLFEGITGGVLDFDYAPCRWVGACGLRHGRCVPTLEQSTDAAPCPAAPDCSMLISHAGRSKRMWFNVSQEGKSAVEDLREKGYVNAIKVSGPHAHGSGGQNED